MPVSHAMQSMQQKSTIQSSSSLMTSLRSPTVKPSYNVTGSGLSDAAVGVMGNLDVRNISVSELMAAVQVGMHFTDATLAGVVTATNQYFYLPSPTLLAKALSNVLSSSTTYTNTVRVGDTLTVNCTQRSVGVGAAAGSVSVSGLTASTGVTIVNGGPLAANIVPSFVLNVTFTNVTPGTEAFTASFV
jgi:hypothetical protein